MDFKNINDVWKLERYCITCIELIFKFCLSEFCFEFDFFSLHKSHLKFFVFEILFIADYSLSL